MSRPYLRSKLACKASVFCNANDLDVETDMTETWDELKNYSKRGLEGGLLAPPSLVFMSCFRDDERNQCTSGSRYR